MLNLIHPLVGASSFIPHGHCYLWKPTLVWLHLTSDLFIALAYYSIPILLIDFARKREDLPFRWLFWLFGAFIVCCGTTHLLDVWTLWHPIYWITGGLKAITALVSLITAAALFSLIPQALALPSPAQITALNQSLQAEMVERRQIETVLRSREASLKEAQSLAHLGNWEFDLATQKITWSEELFRIFGLDPAQPEPGYEEHLQTFHPESRQQLDAVVQQTAVTGEPYELELQIFGADGFAGWIASRGKAVKNSQGEVVGLFGTVLDITERKQAEEALRNLSDRLTLAVKSGAIAIWDWNIPEGILTWDDRMYELYGITPDAFTNVYEAWANSVHPDDRPFAESAIQQSLAGEKDYDPEFRVIHPDGTIRFIKAYALVQRNAQGEPQQMVGINYDITDRKQVEQQLRLQDIIVKNMAEGICLVKAEDGTIVYANPKFEQMLGYESGELASQPVSVINYEGETAEVQALVLDIMNHINACGEYSYELRNVRKDGTPLWCRATTSRFEHPAYGVVYVAVQADISERKRAEAEAQVAIQIKATLQEKEASLREKEVLLQEIHHRVKNNLQIIDGLLQMQSRRTDNPQAAAILLESQHRVKSIALVHEKLYQSEDLAKINFSDYLHSLVATLFDSYKTASNHITRTVQVDDIELNIDTAIPCGLIVNELISNALKYAFPDDRDGEVRLDFHAQDPNQWVLSVKDTGIGIPEHIDLQKTRSLGLKLVRGFAEQLEGSVEINCSQGTLISITFPQQ
ncbi:MAG TPA: PAS domain-containing protein [Coleofasciculaceae cyanobacterium]